jgi:hypothetical protein
MTNSKTARRQDITVADDSYVRGMDNFVNNPLPETEIVPFFDVDHGLDHLGATLAHLAARVPDIEVGRHAHNASINLSKDSSSIVDANQTAGSKIDFSIDEEPRYAACVMCGLI